MKEAKVINCGRCSGQGVILSLATNKWDLCTVCGGGGKVKVPHDCQICPVCKGKGAATASGENCHRCAGVGRIAKSVPELR